MTAKARLPIAPGRFVDADGRLTRDARAFMEKLYQQVIATGSPVEIADGIEQRVTDVEALAASNVLSTAGFGKLTWN